MRRALALASLGRGGTSPNPLVGAVVARGDKVCGQGFHRRAGEPHAEVFALAQAGRRARGATLYTNLEPCCHTGRTPPCVMKIVQAGITRVVAAIKDPDPRVDGGGFRRLRRRGVEVTVGVLRSEAARLNQAFAKFVRTGLPMVTLKGAVSLDGRIATRAGDSKWITSAEAREHARLLRRENDVVMVGIGTVLADDPHLTARSGRYALIRTVVDTHLRLPLKAKLVRTVAEGPVVVFCGGDAPYAREEALTKRGVTVRRLPLRRHRLDLKKCLESLSTDGVTRVLVEGGGELHATLLEQGLADRFLIYVAPRLIGGREARSLVGGIGPRLMNQVKVLNRPRYCRVGDNILVDVQLSAFVG